VEAASSARWGEPLVGPIFMGKSAFWLRTLKKPKSPESKFGFNVVGHYSRPNVFLFNINEQLKEVGAFRNLVNAFKHLDQ